MYEEQNNEQEKQSIVGLVVSIGLAVVLIFTLLVFHYVIGPSNAHRYNNSGNTPSSVTKVSKYKLDWHDGYANVDGGITRLPNYVFSPVVDATQVTHAISEDELKTKFQNTIWPLGDKVAVVMGLGKADFRSDKGYNTLTYRKNPDTANKEELRYDCDPTYITLSYSKMIETSTYSPDGIIPILNNGADYTGVQLNATDLTSNINELLSRKFKDQYDDISLTYRDSQTNAAVRIEHTTTYIGDDKRADVMIFTFERNAPTVKLN